MKITLDKKSNMLNIQFKDEPSTESAELLQGIIVDYNSNGEIVGLEIEEASKFDLSRFSFDILNNQVG